MKNSAEVSRVQRPWKAVLSNISKRGFRTCTVLQFMDSVEESRNKKLKNPKLKFRWYHDGFIPLPWFGPLLCKSVEIWCNEQGITTGKNIFPLEILRFKKLSKWFDLSNFERAFSYEEDIFSDRFSGRLRTNRWFRSERRHATRLSPSKVFTETSLN